MTTRSFQTPYAYFITFTTYGTWLHGDQRSSVDRNHNQFDAPRIKENPFLYEKMKMSKSTQPFIMNQMTRQIVLESILKTSLHFQWEVFAAHVRSNHVHIVVSSNNRPEEVMKKLKAYASQTLNQTVHQRQHRQYWTRHGSTRYIWKSSNLYQVMRYVVHEQGKMMACHYQNWFDQAEILD